MLVNRLSPSMLIDYCNCPKLFYYRYVAKIQLPTKQIHLVFGTAVHAAVEAIYENEDPFKRFSNEFDKEKLTDEEKELYNEFHELGLEMVKNYNEQHSTLNDLYSLNDGKSEIYFRDHVRNPLTGEMSTLPISGRIDRLTNLGKVVEYKTSKNPWKEEDIAFKTQTLIYNLWYLTKFDKLPDETLYIVLIKKRKKVGKGEVIQLLSNHSTIDELASVFDELELITSKIECREFDRPKGYHPKWCDCWKYDELLKV